jgi:hypothetical protein
MLCARVASDALLSGSGVGNEIAFYIFHYAPEQELQIRDHLRIMLDHIPNKKPDLRVRHVNLFDLVLDLCLARIRSFRTVDLSRAAEEALAAMLRLLLVLLRGLRSAVRSRADLMLENLALRQQLAAFAHSGRRPRIGATDRLFWMMLRRLWSRWLDVLVFVKPETVIRWHRVGFRFYWTWRSRRRKPGRPPTDRGIRDLIQRMATENPTWGAPRIHGELRLLGFEVSERTVSRYLPRRRPRPDAVAQWRSCAPTAM